MRSAHPPSSRSPAIRMRSVAVAVASALAGTAWANPSGPSVAAGSASFSGSGNTLNITNTPGTIINWQQFSIRPDEVTRFIQSGAMSAVLNRVVTAEQSQILGQLLSNGRVFLINPNGVTVGAGARIDTAGFIASSLNISDADFLSGRMRFSAVNGTAGKVVNEGTITASSGGSVYLIAPSVENHGVITAPNGDVLLAAGKSVEVVASTSPHIRVEITAPAESEALNVGQVVGGRIGIYGGLVRNAGTLNATTAMVGENGNIILKSNGDVRLEGGVVKAAAVDGGAIRIEGDRVVQGAAVDASGASGGSVSIQANTVLQSARVDARGTSGQGGVIDVQSGGSLIQTASTVLDASGTTAGGSVTVQGTGERRVFSSARMDATSTAGVGGDIKVLGDDIMLAGARLDASGDAGGGRVLVGGDFRGANPDVPNAQYVTVNSSSSIAANANTQGNGGDIVVWADQSARSAGTIHAKGGAAGGAGGRIEVSGKASVQVSGDINASAPNGAAGSLLIDPKNILIEAVAPTGSPYIELNDPNPGANENFGSNYAVVGGAYAVVADPQDQGGIGAAYVFDVGPASPTQGQLRSVITGSRAGDAVGSGGIEVLDGANSFIVRSPGWLGTTGSAPGAGALTFGTAAGGFAVGGGVVGAGNSLVGDTPGAGVGGATLDQFVSGSRFALVNAAWNGDRGAVTFGDAFAGMPVGILSNANSIVGTATGDAVGGLGLTSVGPTLNEGVVIASPAWNGARGAVTYVSMAAPLATPGDGTIAPIAGTFGDVSGATNSLVGAQANQAIGSGGVVRLTNGNYVVVSPAYSGAGGTETNAGAVTWVNGATGRAFGEANVFATVSGTNSLRGSVNDRVGSGGITELIGAGAGNFVISSPSWSGTAGASTWVDGALGAAGTVGAANSLTGTAPGDFAGQTITPLTNGNYVLLSPSFQNNGGAVTLVAGVAGGGGQPIANGATQAYGQLSAANSLLGGSPGAFTDAFVREVFDGVTGTGYVVFAPSWGGNVGAMTFSPSGGAGAGPTAPISALNSLVGSVSGDRVGSGPDDAFLVTLSNGWYAIHSPEWSNGAATAAGAVTFFNATNAGARLRGTVSSANSLVGSTAGDRVGTFNCDGSCNGIVDMLNGAYLVSSPDWSNGAASRAGAVTLVDPVNGSAGGSLSNGIGVVSAANSIHGTSTNDSIGNSNVIAADLRVYRLTGDRFAIGSPDWSNGAAAESGAVTFGSISSWTPGAVSTANSLYGGAAGDRIGSSGVQQHFSAGGAKFGLTSLFYDQSRGAVTFFDANSPPVGQTVSPANSVVGQFAGDNVGSNGWFEVNGGRALILSANWNGGMGAATVVDVSGPVTAVPVSAATSFTGINSSDQVGAGGVYFLPNGNFVVASEAGGAVGLTFMTPTATRAGQTLSTANSLIGSGSGSGSLRPASAPLDFRVLGSGDYIVVNPGYGAAGQGMIAFGSATTGAVGTPSVSNAWLGSATAENLGSRVELTAGDQFVFNAPGATKGADADAGRLFIATPAGLGGGAPFTGTLSYTDFPDADVTISAAQIATILNNGTQVLLQASNDITVNAPITANAGNTLGSASLTMQAGRSILVNQNIENSNVDGATGRSVALQANDPAAVGTRDPGLGELRVAPGIQVKGAGDVLLEVLDGTAPGTAGGMTIGSVAGANVEIFNSSISTPAFDANRSIDLQPGAQLVASQRFALIADGNVRFGAAGGAGAKVSGATTTLDVVSFGSLTGGTGTLVDSTGVTSAPARLTAQSIGTPANPFGVVAGAIGMDAVAGTGGIHLLHTGADVDASTYLMDAPNGQSVSLGVAGTSNLFVQAWNVVNSANNDVRLYTGGGDIVLGEPANGVTVDALALQLDAPGGRVFSGGGITINAPLTVTSPMFVTGGTTTFGNTADLASLSVTGNGTTLNIGPAATTTGTLNWGSFGTAENNTIAGLGTSSLVVTGSASISGDGTRTLNNATLVNSPGAIASYAAGTGPGAFLFGGAGGIDNSGTFLIANGNAFDSATGLLHTFLNRAPGVVDKAGGTPTSMGTSGTAGVALLNQGVVSLTGGDLVLNTNAAHSGAFNVGAGHILTLNNAQTLQAASSVTGAGGLAVAAAGSALNVNGAVDIAGLGVSNGVVTINSAVATDAYNQSGGTVVGPGDLTVRQSFNRSAGVFGSSPFGNLSINQASGNLVFNTQSPTASLKLTAPTGTVTVANAVNVSGAVEYGAGAGVTVNNTTNAASFRVAGGGGDATLNGPVAVTGLADLSGGNVTIAGIFGAGSLNALATAPGGTVALDVPANITGAADISGANVDFNGTFSAGSVKAVATTGVLGVNAPVTATGAVELDGATVSVLRDVQGASIRFVSPAVTLDNVTLTGPIDASTASVSIPDGSAVTLNGNGNVFRDVGMGGNNTSLILTGANTVTNSFAWQGGTGISSISGGSLTLNGTTAIGGDGVHVFDNVQVTNNGTMMFGPTFLTGGPLVIENGATLTNNATFDLQNDQPIVSTVGTGTLRNAGNLVKNATPTGTTLIGDPGAGGTLDFINTGIVQVNAGNIEFGQAPSVAQAGSYSMGPIGGLIFSNGTHTLNGVVSGGTLGVSGTASVTIANTGTLNANTMAISGGALAIDGTANTGVYNQSGGVVGGTGNLIVGSDFSQTGGSFGNLFNVLSVTQAVGDISGSGFGAVGQLSLSAPGGAVNITTPLSLAGAANFFGGTGINVSAPITAAAVGMVTGGTASISNATVNATSGAITVSAGQVQVAAGTAPAGLIGAGGVTVVSLNDVVVQGGSATGAAAQINALNGPLAISVQRDLKILGGSGANASARVVGDPDVGSAAAPIKVGGEIVMQEGTGAGATARVESVSPNSIYVLFPNASSGGYTVNGLAVTSDNGSGFYAGGVPAILDQNLWITYGIPATVQIDPGTLVTALNRSTETLDSTVEEEKRQYLESLFGDIDDIPICK